MSSPACWDARLLPRDHHVRADAVVIGTGAGGACAGYELARAGWRVVFLEEGPYLTGEAFRGDALAAFRTVYRNHGLTGTLGRPPITIPLGRCVGGTTTVNSGTCYRTPQFVLEHWERELGLAGATELGPDYEALEAELPVELVPDELYGPQHSRVEAAARELGWAGSRIPRNAQGCIATGVCPLGCPSDGKMAMSVGKIPAALELGAELWVHARAVRLLRHGRQVLGVVAESTTPDGEPRHLTVTAALTVVACGALHTPAFLLANGIRHPWLGRNLHIHPATRVVAAYPEPIEGWREVPQAYNVDEFIPDGVFIQGQFVGPDLQAAVLPGWGHAHQERMRRYAHFASFGALISDVSAGRIRRLPGSIAPVATYRLLPEDLRKLLFGIARTAELFLVSGAEEVYTGVADLPIVRSRSEVAQLERLATRSDRVEMMAFHPMGTARAGDPRWSVCDPWGRVHGWHGLAVADASLLPTSNKINPQLTIMALARRAARAWAATGV